jgi:hypothetical protein
MSPRERSPIGNDARRAVRERRVAGQACAVCGEVDPETLVAIGRTLLEFHHVAGEANDPDVGLWLCRNCHAISSARQRDVGVDLRRDERRHVLERLEAALRSIASFLELLAGQFYRFADDLFAVISRLDTAFPSWRVLTQGESDE